jgi:hypothetical protein
VRSASSSVTTGGAAVQTIGIRLTESKVLGDEWKGRSTSWKWLGWLNRAFNTWDIERPADQLIAPGAVAETIGKHLLKHGYYAAMTADEQAENAAWTALAADSAGRLWQ